MTPHTRKPSSFSFASRRRARALWWSILAVSLLGGCDPADDDADDGAMGTEGHEHGAPGDAGGRDDGGDDAPDGDGGGPGADGGASGGDPPPTGTTACGDLLDCYGGCDDGACMMECYEAASPEARALDDALYACEVEQGCQDIECIQTKCASELEACLGSGGSGGGQQPPAEPPADPPAGSWLCYAQGQYQVCIDGLCQTYSADSAGMGPSQPEAGTAAVINCDGHMTNMVIIHNTNGSASVVSPCAVTNCISE